MTKLDWLLLAAYGLPLACYAAEFWWEAFHDVVYVVRVGIERLRSRREG